MAWERIVQRLGSVWSCCPECRSVEVESQEEFGLDELAAVACRKCGWEGIYRELDGIPVPDQKQGHKASE